MIIYPSDQVFHDPVDIFWTGKVMDILFDGIPVDCSADSFEAQAVCSVFSTGEVSAVVPYNDTHYKFSLFASVRYFNPIQYPIFNFTSLFFVFPSKDKCN